MSAEFQFTRWRRYRSSDDSWALVWYLANELCKRFYSSHGIAPQVIIKEGLGFYGIGLAKTECKVNEKEGAFFGRLTCHGNVENFETAGPGSHGLNVTEMCDRGYSLSSLVAHTIANLRLPSIPEKSHMNCRHKRWGSSYELCFEISALLAIRHYDQIEIYNHPDSVRSELADRDPNFFMKEHLGAFLFRSKHGSVLIAGDGRILERDGDSLWDQYMQGESISDLANSMAIALGIWPAEKDVSMLLAYESKLYPDSAMNLSNLNEENYGSEGAFTSPTVSHTSPVDEFYTTLATDIWTDTQYSPHAVSVKLRRPDYIESASLEELRSILTYCERGEKYCDGHWNAMISDGVIRKVLQRLRTMQIDSKR